MKSVYKAKIADTFISSDKAAETVSVLLKRKKNVLFLCGAGISYAPPACAPLWPSLRNDLLSAFLERLANTGHLTTKDFRRTLESVHSLEKKNDLWIKPEVAMHWFHRTFRDELFGAFAVLQQGSSNSNHHILAALAKKRLISSLLTTNFDLYLEKALYDRRTDFIVFTGLAPTSDTFPLCTLTLNDSRNPAFRLVKVHGTLLHTQTIQATLEQVGHEFPSAVSMRLALLVQEHHVVVVGYSGNDYDLFPFLKAEAPKMSSITWLCKNPMSLNPEVPKLREDICLAVGDVNQFFRRISESLHLPVVKQVPIAHARNQDLEAAKTLSQWASCRDELLVAYTLSLFARHIGLSEFTEIMCKIGRKLLSAWECRFLNVHALSLRRKSPKEAMRLFVQAERLAKSFRHKFPATYSNITGNIGSLLHETGSHSKALKWLRVSNSWAKRVKNQRLTYSNDDDIGNCLRAMGRAQASVTYHRRAIHFHKTNDNLIALALALNNLGLAYLDLKKYREAYRVLKQSMKLKREETADIPALMRGLLSLGTASARLGKHEEALKYFNEGLALSPVVDDKVTSTRIQYELAALHWAMDEKVLAFQWFTKAEKTAKRVPFWSKDRYRMRQIREIIELFR